MRMCHRLSYHLFKQKDSIIDDVVIPGENKVPAGVAKVLEKLRNSLNVSNLTDTQDSECRSEEP